MLRCFTARYIPQFQFFKEFLDETVSQVEHMNKLCEVQGDPKNPGLRQLVVGIVLCLCEKLFAIYYITMGMHH